MKTVSDPSSTDMQVVSLCAATSSRATLPKAAVSTEAGAVRESHAIRGPSPSRSSGFRATHLRAAITRQTRCRVLFAVPV